MGRLETWLRALMARRKPDFIIGGAENPYIRRWWLIRRNRLFNCYLHEIIRSDDDRALHDHPWINCSFLIAGSYLEHTIEAGGVHRRRRRAAGDLVWRRAVKAHRLEVDGAPALSLFFTGPVIRSWGFHCPAGWRHWREFTAGPDGSRVGRGCD